MAFLAVLGSIAQAASVAAQAIGTIITEGPLVLLLFLMLVGWALQPEPPRPPRRPRATTYAIDPNP